MISQIHIQKCVNSRAKDLDFDNIPLGKTFTDHMFLCSYESGFLTPKSRIESVFGICWFTKSSVN